MNFKNNLLMIQYLALFLVMLSTSISISSPSSPLIAWLGLELNSLSFIPLMKNKNNLSSNESMIKYFLIQTITSTLFLTPTLLFYHNIFNYSPFFNMTFSTMMTFALLTKLAVAPLHFWMFPLVNSISWLSFMLLMTWQKIAPLFMVSYLFSMLMVISIIMSTVLPPISSINQNSMKMILMYASITHMAWLLSINLVDNTLLYPYIIMYMLNFIPIFLILSFWNITYLSQIIFIPNSYKLLLFLITLSLSGFPPLTMFLLKVMLISQLIQNITFYLTTGFLLLASLMMTYTYIYSNFPLLMKNFHYPLKIFMPKTSFFSLLMSSPLISIPIMMILLI